MRYPEFLKEKGRIGFIAPSFGAVIEPYHTMFEHALTGFEEMGYKVVLGPNCFEDQGIGKSNTPEECGNEINDFFLYDMSDIIISCGGGETMCEDLPFVDFSAIAKAQPKWFIGYSDNTNLTFTLPTLADTAAIYGPCAASFGMEPWHAAIQDAFDLLHGKKLTMHNYDLWEKEDAESEDLLAPYHVTEPFSMVTCWKHSLSKDITAAAETLSSEASAPIHFSGRLLGGCLDCLTVLCGTPYDQVDAFAKRYEQDGIIWFLEACDLSPLGIRRALWQLDQACWFQTAKGFLIGRPKQMDEGGMGLNHISAVTEILEKYQVPILLDIDLGHLPPMMPIISGACADITAGENTLEIQYRLI